VCACVCVLVCVCVFVYILYTSSDLVGAESSEVAL